MLYYAPDNASLVVRLTLEELGVPFEAHLVDRAKGEQETPAYRKLNPQGKIPACIIGGEAVCETGAIVLALADRHGALAPGLDDPKRAKFLQWLFFLSNTLHADLRLAFYPERYAGPELAPYESYAAMTFERIARHFGILENYYAAHGTPYLHGAEPTVVDIYLATVSRWAQLYPGTGRNSRIDVTMYPSLLAMFKRLEARPAIARGCTAEGMAAPFFSAATEAVPTEGTVM